MAKNDKKQLEKAAVKVDGQPKEEGLPPLAEVNLPPAPVDYTNAEPLTISGGASLLAEEKSEEKVGVDTEGGAYIIEKTFTAEEVEEFKKTWNAMPSAPIQIETIAAEPRLPIAKELETAVNDAIANDNREIANELNILIECLMKLRNQMTNVVRAHDADIVKRIKKEVLGVQI